MTTMTDTGWRNGQGGSGYHMVDAEPYRTLLRRAWRTHTLGELSAITGLSPSTLRRVMWRSEHVQVRTAAALLSLLPEEAPHG